MNYATLMLKCNKYGYYDTAFLIMNLIYNRRISSRLWFLRDTILFHGLHMSLSVSPPVPLVETLLVRRLLSSLELPSLPLVTVC